jgi:hypothetical protein
MTVLQKTSAVLVGIFFCFLHIGFVQAEDLYCNCDYEIAISGCRGQRQGTDVSVETGGTYFRRFPFELDGTKTLGGIESAMNGFIVASCVGKVDEAVTAANSQTIRTTWHGVTTPITSSNCAGSFNAGPPISLVDGGSIPGSLINISCSVGPLVYSAPVATQQCGQCECEMVVKGRDLQSAECQKTEHLAFQLPVRFHHLYSSFLDTIPSSNWSNARRGFLDCGRLPLDYFVPNSDRTEFSLLSGETFPSIDSVPVMETADGCPSEVINAVDYRDADGYYIVSLMQCAPASNSPQCEATGVVGYEAIDFSFPTDKINALNKVGISGTGTTQMQLLLGRLIKYLVGFLGTLALCIVIYAGLQYMVAQGEAEKQHHALGMILWASIGIVALLGAYSIVSFVFQIL